METLQQSLASTAGPLLVAGCAMIALGASAVITAALLWWKRRRPSLPPAEPAASAVTPDDAPTRVVSMPAVDRRRLEHIDRRLEDLETQIVALTERVETVLRPRPQAPSAPRPAAAPQLEVVNAPAPTPEELSLRALVARGH